MFLAYPLTDARFREIVRELHTRHGVEDLRDALAASTHEV